MFCSYVLAFLFGTIVGSFLNVLICRYNTGRSVVSKRSKCFNCNKNLNWFELIPIISFVFQRGRCKKCRSRISFQYPIVELLAGFLFLFIYLKTLGLYQGVLSTESILFFTYSILAFSILIVISVYDLRHKIIPNLYVYLFLIVTIIYKIIVYFLFESSTSEALRFIIGDLFTGAMLFTFFFLIWYLSSGRAMGFGDAKLALGIGIMLGAPQVWSLSSFLYSEALWAILVSFWLGAFVGVILLFLRGRYFTMKSEIPFAPFLVIGATITYFLNVDLIYVTSFLLQV